MPIQVYFIGAILVGVGLLAFLLNKDIKKHNKKMESVKKKKGRSKYLQQTRKPGK